MQDREEESLERTVERVSKLPPFRCDPAALANLEEELKRHFGENRRRLVTTIELDLPGEKLSFNSVRELMEYPRLPAHVRSFSLEMLDLETSRSCTFGKQMFGGAAISADADRESWCAGAVEIGRSFALRPSSGIPL
jgi:hypothetical protein